MHAKHEPEFPSFRTLLNLWINLPPENFEAFSSRSDIFEERKKPKLIIFVSFFYGFQVKANIHLLFKWIFTQLCVLLNWELGGGERNVKESFFSFWKINFFLHRIILYPCRELNWRQKKINWIFTFSLAEPLTHKDRDSACDFFAFSVLRLLLDVVVFSSTWWRSIFEFLSELFMSVSSFKYGKTFFVSFIYNVYRFHSAH